MGAETEYPDLPTAEELAKSEYGKVPTYDDNFKGPINERGCTDVFFCILFLVFLVGLAIVTFVGFSKGEPERLLYGEDSFGNICGQVWTGCWLLTGCVVFVGSCVYVYHLD